MAQTNATNPPFAIAEQEVQADLSMQHNQASEATAGFAEQEMKMNLALQADDVAQTQRDDAELARVMLVSRS